MDIIFSKFLLGFETTENSHLIESIRIGYCIIHENMDEYVDIIKVNNYVYHKSPPIYRDSILTNGIKASVGEQRYGDQADDTPKVFATNSDDENEWFDSTYDDDVWKINTNLIKSVDWYKDSNFINNHIYTLSDIPANAIELIYKGSGESY